MSRRQNIKNYIKNYHQISSKSIFTFLFKTYNKYQDENNEVISFLKDKGSLYSTDGT